MSEPSFVAGLSARQDPAAERLRRVREERPAGFAPADLIARIEAAFGGGSDAPAGPRHFAPADRDANPTEGWDPLDPAATANDRVDPVETARQAGYDEGYAAARAEWLRDQALVADVAGAVASDTRVDRDALAQRIRQTVTLLVSRLVGEAAVDADLLAERVSRAVDCLADASESALLHVNPADVALLDGKLPATVFAVGDAAVARGAFVMETASTIVEDGPEHWLAQLTAAIDRLPTPTC